MKFLLGLFICISIIACSNSSQNAAIKTIRDLEQNKNLAKSDSMVNSYLRFADAYPDHDSAVEYLFKAAEVSVGMNQIMKGARIYERLATEYKSSKRAPEALIRAGVSLASIQDTAGAKRLYDLFISSFPDHPRIEEVKLWSETSGWSEEKLMERFMEKIKQKDTLLP